MYRYLVIPAFLLSPFVVAEDIERISVTANRATTSGNWLPVSASQAVYEEDLATPVTSVSDFLSLANGVDYNGQGGRLQVLSLRGLSRWRVQSRLSDIPVITERRAGSALSFIDPGLLQSADVVKGPASTYYGSGAIGGVVSLLPKHFQGIEAFSSYQIQDNENLQRLAWGDENWSLGVSHQGANRGEDAAGEELDTGYQQYSAILSHKSQLNAEVSSEWLLLPSYSMDTGKSSLAYPNSKITEYPRERHLMGQWRLTASDWSGALFFHANDLQTQTLRLDKRFNTADTQAFDWGGNWMKNWQSGPVYGRFGLDMVNRSNVSIREGELDFRTDLTRDFIALDGDQYQLGVFADAVHQRGALQFVSGIRLDSQYQDLAQASDSDVGMNGFLGGNYFVSPGLTLRAQLGTGIRFPSLTEKFYSGTTARGSVIGDENLNAERAYNLEVGLQGKQDSVNWKLNLYQVQIHDYIERTRIEDELFQYRNLARGEIRGIEAAVNVNLSSALSWELGGQWQQGKNGQGEHLADIAPKSLWQSVEYQWQSYIFKLHHKYRGSKTQLGSSEANLHAAHLLQASLSWNLNNHISVSVWGKNLFNQTYRLAADDEAGFAQGQRFGVSVSYVGE